MQNSCPFAYAVSSHGPAAIAISVKNEIRLSKRIVAASTAKIIGDRGLFFGPVRVCLRKWSNSLHNSDSSPARFSTQNPSFPHRFVRYYMVSVIRNLIATRGGFDGGTRPDSLLVAWPREKAPPPFLIEWPIEDHLSPEGCAVSPYGKAVSR